MVAAVAAFASPAFASAAQVTVVMTANAYSPAAITVNQGDTVVWVNNDTIAHTVTADYNAFASNTLQPGQSFSYTFNNLGAYPYHCIFHSGMTGTVAVVAQQQPTPVGVDNAQLRAQAEALLAQVTALQAQLAARQGGNTGAGQGVAGLAQQAGVKVVDSSSCPKIGRSLKRGSSGDDVSRLQQFLARDPSIYPEAQVSGYYGALTEAAVRRWQAKFNIVSSGSPEATGFGVVGPRTAAAISLQCSLYAGGKGGSAGSPVGGYVQVSPISGTAPLPVNVQATVNTTNSCTGAVYTLSWGDGSGGVSIPVSAGNCNQQSQTFSHTYQYGGVFLITLSALGHTTTATITVYGPSAPTTPTPTNPSSSDQYGPLNVTPSAGGNPLAITAVFDLPSSCTGYSLSWGDGTTDVTQQDGGSSCAAGTAMSSLSHQYAVPGSYNVTLKRGPTLDKTDTAAVTITN